MTTHTVTPTDIPTITWEAAPEGFDRTGSLYNIQLAEIDDIKLILGHDIDTRKSSIAAEVEGHWYDTSSTQDWPVFDRLFGRKAWQAFVAEHTAQAIAEIEADLDDEE